MQGSKSGASPSRKSSRLSIWLQGAGAAILVASTLLWDHLTPDRQVHYHELLPMNSVYQGLLIDFLVCLLVGVFVVWLLDRGKGGNRSVLWLLLAALLVVRVERCLVVALLVSVHVLGAKLLFLAVAVPLFALWLAKRSWYAYVISGIRLTLLLLGFSVFWILPELTWMAVAPEPHETAGFTRPVSQPPNKRIVWILLDEASYDQLFDHRQPGIAFPNFDRLAGQSVLFTDVRPAGYFTDEVIPSLFLGETVTQETSNLQGQLIVRTQEHHGWRPYPDRNSLFADAQREGWSTGAVGWFNPYCRVYAAELNDCYWTVTSPLPGRYSPDVSGWRNAIKPVEKSVARLVGKRIEDPTPLQVHTGDFTTLLAHGESEINDDRDGFAFIHLPIPHPGGMYNRRTHQVGADGSYLDNLVLADQVIGTLMNDIGRSPLASQTTVIVSSDHSWRVNMWLPRSDWRPEDTRVSGLRFDPRPLLIVHFPGETTGARVSESFPLIRMHNMIDQMLSGKVQDAQQLETWAAQP